MPKCISITQFDFQYCMTYITISIIRKIMGCWNGRRWGCSRWVFANCNISFDTFTSEISQNSDLALSTYHSYLRAKSNLAPTYRAVRTYHIHLSAKCENCSNLCYKTTFLVYTDITCFWVSIKNNKELNRLASRLKNLPPGKNSYPKKNFPHRKVLSPGKKLPWKNVFHTEGRNHLGKKGTPKNFFHTRWCNHLWGFKMVRCPPHVAPLHGMVSRALHYATGRCLGQI